MRVVYFKHFAFKRIEVVFDFLIGKIVDSVKHEDIWTNSKRSIHLYLAVSPLVVAGLFINFEVFKEFENSFPQGRLFLFLRARDCLFETLPIHFPFLVISAN